VSRSFFLAAAAAAVLAAPPLGAADLFGKPLRGLTAVRVADVVAAPEAYATRAVRVEGKNAGGPKKPALKDGEAVLPIESDGTFALPADLEGASLAAEGKAKTVEGRAVFVATGVEVRR
jgi:hypothetical protein